MITISTYDTTGNSYIDGVLTGLKWAVNSLTYSFPDAAADYGTGYGSGEPQNNFAPFTSAQQAAVTSVLAVDAAVANLTFSEVSESASVHAVLRYAESDAVGTA